MVGEDAPEVGVVGRAMSDCSEEKVSTGLQRGNRSGCRTIIRRVKIWREGTAAVECTVWVVVFVVPHCDYLDYE